MPNRHFWHQNCHDLEAYERDVGFYWALDLFDTPLTTLNYNVQWRSRQFSNAVYIALSLFHDYGLQFTSHASSLRLLSLHQYSGAGFQRRMIPFLGSRTIPTRHSHGDCWLTMLSPSSLTPLVPICTVSQKLNPARSRSYFTTDGQSVNISWCWTHSGTCDQILLPVGMLRSFFCGDGSAGCSAIAQFSKSRRTRNHTLLSHLEGQVPIFISPRNKVALLYPQGLGPLYFVPVDSQGYGGGILTLPQPGRPGPRIYITQEQDGPVKSQSHVTTDGQAINMSWCWVHAALEGCIWKNFNLTLGGIHYG
jgi:hypothetical protein